VRHLVFCRHDKNFRVNQPRWPDYLLDLPRYCHFAISNGPGVAETKTTWFPFLLEFIELQGRLSNALGNLESVFD